VLFREHFHLVVAHDNGDIGFVGLENICQFANRLLASIVTLTKNGGRYLLGEILGFAQRNQLVEGVRLPVIEMLRIRPIRFDALRPDLGPHGKHRPM
jgi:hypothetical protein